MFQKVSQHISLHVHSILKNRFNLKFSKINKNQIDMNDNNNSKHTILKIYVRQHNQLSFHSPTYTHVLVHKFICYDCMIIPIIISVLQMRQKSLRD